MEKINWKIEGMSCINCALTIADFLNKQGMQKVQVNFIGGEVHFEMSDPQLKEILVKGIAALGYKVIPENTPAPSFKKSFFSLPFNRFLFCLPFTIVLMWHMLPWHIHLLMNAWVQLAICLPVMIVGAGVFGLSAVRSLRRGIPNMDVLIALGSSAAFVYSLMGTIGNLGMDYLFYETSASIITFILLGKWIENTSIQTTQRALNKLAGSQKTMANMIAFDEHHKEIIFPVENTQLRIGDIILIKSGEQIPADCKILWGDAYVNEALLTGESAPVHKKQKEIVLGGSLVTDGTIKAQVTAVGSDTALGTIVNLVKQAQNEKPPIQQFADKISAVFVPVVIALSALTFLMNHFVFHIGFSHSLMRSIAVLVVSCPCAMGLATPAAVAVGLGRATRNGILFRNAKSLEVFKNIGAVVFDKTGTLTKGVFTITDYQFQQDKISEKEFKEIIFSLEKYSNHPIAKSVTDLWKTNTFKAWKKINEIKGIGIKAEDKEGNVYQLLSYKGASSFTDIAAHTAYLIKNNTLLGWLDAADEIRPEVKEVIGFLHSKKIKTYLLSGDTAERCNKVATAVGITEIFAEKSPLEKLKIIEQLNQSIPTAMVGDGINDAPALAKAAIGISMSDAAQIAVQTAQVVLMNNSIQNLPLALGLGKYTFVTIKENLFWAFFYNILAIPIAAVGGLNPAIAALAMGLSDVVLIINSVRLNYRKAL